MDSIRAWRDRVTGKVYVWALDGVDVVRSPEGVWRQETVRPEGLAHERFVPVDLEEAEALHLDARLAIAKPAAQGASRTNRRGGFRVVVDDNFHYTDLEERSHVGTFATREEAVARAREIVERSLRSFYQSGMTVDELWDYYTSFGDDPFIVPDTEDNAFSAWTYAKAIVPRVIADESRGSHGY